MNRYLISFGLALAVAIPAFAQTATSTPREQMRDARQQFVQTAKQERADLKATIESQRAAMRATVEARRGELKQQLQKVKDERKRAAVERIDGRLVSINEQRTFHFTNVVGKIEKVLANVIERTDKAETTRDVALARTAITRAQSAIQAAYDAIIAQAGKTYAITVASETTVRADVQKSAKALQADSNAVREKVKAAHEAVRKAAVALAQATRTGVTATSTESSTTATSSAQ